MNAIASNHEAIDGRRVMVTGACGFIGSHLVRSLVDAGADVLGIDREQAGLESASSPAPVRTMDLSSLPDVLAAFDDFRPEYVYHLASAADGQEEFDQVLRSIHGGIGLTVNLLEAFRQFPGDLFVFGDSSKVYGDPGVGYRASLPEDPRSSYAIAKSAAWQFCQYHRRLYGSNVVSVRPTLVYGPGQPRNLISYVIGSVVQGESKITLMGGKQTRDPLHCSDLVNAYLAIPDRRNGVSGKVINLGGGFEISVADLVAKIASLAGADLQIEIDDSQLRPTDSMRSYCQNDEAEEWLGWRPQVDLDAGLGELIALQVAAGAVAR